MWKQVYWKAYIRDEWRFHLDMCTAEWAQNMHICNLWGNATFTFKSHIYIFVAQFLAHDLMHTKADPISKSQNFLCKPLDDI